MSKSGEAPFRLKPGSALAGQSAQMQRRYGPPRALALQPEFVIASAAHKLAAGQGDFSPLDRRETKGALELAWRESPPWTMAAPDVETWLVWAEKHWKPAIAATRICLALLRHYDPDHPATALLLHWLAPREKLLWGRFGEFARQWALMRGEAAVEPIAQKLAAGDLAFLHEAQQNIRAKIALQESGFIFAVAESYGQRCAKLDWAAAQPVVAELLPFLGARGVAGSDHLHRRRKVGRMALLCGVVEMAARAEVKAAIAFALEVAFLLIGDPRVEPAEWRDAPEPIAEKVEAWLVERTLDAAFQIVDELKTDDDAEWRRRQAFWRHYLPHIRRARLLCAPKARRAAEKRGEPSCVLDTYLSDHCGLLLELRGPGGARLNVVEINNRAQAMFWPEGEANAPSFADSEFDGSQMRKKCQNLLSHLPPDGWPAKFAELIAEHTGICG